MHLQALDPKTALLVREFGSGLSQPGFMLCGGTAVALWFGHRQSEDLDFLTPAPFNERELASWLLTLPTGVSINECSAGTVNATVGGVRVQYLHQQGVDMEADAKLGGMSIANIETLSALKCNAMASRAAKKDFVDCFVMCHEGAGFPGLMQAAQRRAPALNMRHVLRSFTYFDVADGEPAPVMLVPLDWTGVKAFFLDSVGRFLETELGVMGPMESTPCLDSESLDPEDGVESSPPEQGSGPDL